jgi:O-antigen/teichoic acid export membrane protein
LNRVQQSPIGKRIVGGTFWSVVGNGFGKMFTFIAMVLVARILGKEAFGEFGLVRSTAMTFVAFSSFGMGITATKYIAELLHTDKERTGRLIGLTYWFTIVSSFFVSVIFYCLVPWLCETKLNVPDLIPVMKLSAVLLFLTTITGTQISVMTGFQDFRGMAIANLLGGLTMAPIYVFGAYWWGVWGVVIAAILAVILNLLINSGFIYRNTRKYQVRYAILQAYQELPVLWKSNIPLVISSVIVSFSYWIPQVLLMQQPNGTAELGIYHVVLNFQAIMLFLPQQLYPIFLPLLSELNGKQDNDRYWHVIGKGLLLNLIISLIVIIPFVLFPKWFLGLVGMEFVDGWIAMQIACISMVINSLGTAFYQIPISKGKNWLNLCFAFITTSMAILLVLLPALSYDLGVIGVFLYHITGSIIFSLLIIITYVIKDKKRPNKSKGIN